MPNIERTTTLLITFSLLFFLAISCHFLSTEPLKKEELQVDYYVRFLEADKQVKAKINFARIDSTQKMIPQIMEEVLFADKALSGKKIGNQYTYQMTQTMPFANSYDLTYRLNHLTTTSIAIDLERLNNFSVKKGKISKSAGTTLYFEEGPATNKETLVLLISDSTGRTMTIKIGNHTANTPIIVLPKQVNHLSLGNGTLYLVKKESVQKQLDNAQLIGNTEYYSAVKTITIID